jgi:hypothetical protein
MSPPRCIPSGVLSAIPAVLLASCGAPVGPTTPAGTPPEPALAASRAFTQSFDAAALVGFWEEGLGHGRDRRNAALLFSADGTWEYRAGGYEHLPGFFPADRPEPEIARGGSWLVDAGRLVLTVAWRDVYTGGTVVPADEISPPSVQGGAIVRRPVEPPVEETVRPAACSAGNAVLAAGMDLPCWSIPLAGAPAEPWVPWSGSEEDPALAWCGRGPGGRLAHCLVRGVVVDAAE